MKRSIFISILFTAIFFTLNAQEQQKQVVVHEISKAELVKMNGLTDLVKKFEPATDYSQHAFRSFEFSINTGNAEGKKELNAGPDFNAAVKKLISESKPGTKFCFEKIGAMEPQKRIMMTVPSIFLQVKE